jgi:hypothetical protein
MGWLGIGAKLLPYIVEAVVWVEKFIKAKGQPKQDAAVHMVQSILGLAEQGADKNLLSNRAVEEATRSVIDAVVKLNNVIASKGGNE